MDGYECGGIVLFVSSGRVRLHESTFDRSIATGKAEIDVAGVLFLRWDHFRVIVKIVFKK